MSLITVISAESKIGLMKISLSCKENPSLTFFMYALVCVNMYQQKRTLTSDERHVCMGRSPAHLSVWTPPSTPHISEREGQSFSYSFSQKRRDWTRNVLIIWFSLDLSALISVLSVDCKQTAQASEKCLVHKEKHSCGQNPHKKTIKGHDE